MSVRTPVLYAFCLTLAGLALASAPQHHRRPKPGKRHSQIPSLIVAPGNHFSLSKATAACAAANAAAASSSAASSEEPALKLKLILRGGGQKTWVSESCNPVVAVVNGEMRPLRQCFTDFYARVALAPGRDGSFEFELPVAYPQRPLKVGDSVRLLMTLGTDCSKSTGPGLFAFGDCKVREQILSAPFVIKE